jgi:hypothetical protein
MKKSVLGIKHVTTRDWPIVSALPNRNKHMKEETPKHHDELEERKHQNGEVKEIRGTVVNYLLNPRGEVDGLLLEDGAFIKFPPHLGRELVQVAKPGDEVIAIGLPEGPKLLRGHVIVNPKAELGLREIKPVPPERASFVGPLQPLRAEGRIRHAKRNPHGDIDGAILEDGTILQFPPQPGEALVTNWRRTNRCTRLVSARQTSTVQVSRRRCWVQIRNHSVRLGRLITSRNHPSRIKNL